MRQLVILPLLFAVAGCGATSAPTPAPQAQPDADAIVDTVLALAAHEVDGREPLCVSIGEESFELKPVPSRAQARWDWYTPPRPGSSPAPVDAALRARLDAALAARRQLAGERAPRPLDAARLAPPMRLRTGGSGLTAECPRSLDISFPWAAGDIAFVETGYTCGGPCGHGQVLALERRVADWRLVAIVPTWIS